MPDEFDLIGWIRERASRWQALESIPIGIGDDAAGLLFTPGEMVLATTDAVVEGTHFKMPPATARDVGRKAMAVNLSDIAAMGCVPRYALASLVFRKGDTLEFAEELCEGLIGLAAEFDVALVGGNVAVAPDAGGLSVSVTVLGETAGRPPARRSGAQPGDVVMVTGKLGGSVLGRHMRFTPRVKEGLWLNRNVDLRAMIDVSDGLAADLGHVLEESGMGAVLYEEAIPISEDALKLSRDSGTPAEIISPLSAGLPDLPSGTSALEHALSDGEDFELLFAVSESDARRLESKRPFEAGVTRIGMVMSGRRLCLRRPDGSELEIGKKGYRHTFERTEERKDG